MWNIQDTMALPPPPPTSVPVTFLLGFQSGNFKIKLLTRREESISHSKSVISHQNREIFRQCPPPPHQTFPPRWTTTTNYVRWSLPDRRTSRQRSATSPAPTRPPTPRPASATASAGYTVSGEALTDSQLSDGGRGAGLGLVLGTRCGVGLRSVAVTMIS